MSATTTSHETLLPLGGHPTTAWHVNASHADLTRSTAPAPRPQRIAAYGKSLMLDLARTALVVIDMQAGSSRSG